MLDDPPTVLECEWYDCPFCYVGQHRTAILVRHGHTVAGMMWIVS
jgi:hypothetical protein